MTTQRWRASAARWACPAARRFRRADRRSAHGHHGRDQRAADRRGERVVLVTTRGFKDQLRIGYQNRPRPVRAEDRAARHAVRARDRGRRARDGRRRVACARSTRRRSGRARKTPRADGFTACAIVFLHGYRYPAHETRAAEIARGLGFTQVSTSHETVALVSSCQPRRHDGGRRLSVAGAGALCAPHRRGARRHAAPVHDVEWRARRAALLPRQGCDPVRPGGRRGRHGGDGARRPAFRAPSASTWAAPRPTCRASTAISSASTKPKSRASGCACR